jgi:hypothetical protein
MTLDQLYTRAAHDGIEIDDVRMRELRAVSFPEGWIAIDSTKYESLTAFKCDLAHEIGHCETGSFYNIYSPYDLKEKCERKANRRAVEILMPVNEVRRALHRGIVEPWALAEYFDVTQQFVQIAFEIYADELTRHRRVVGLSPMIRASDLPPRPHKPAVMRDMAMLKRLGILTDIKHDPLFNLPDYYY